MRGAWQSNDTFVAPNGTPVLLWVCEHVCVECSFEVGAGRLSRGRYLFQREHECSGGPERACSR